MIKVQNLEKSYDQKRALKGISFQVQPGQIFGLLGPNGAGKTTTLKILTGQLLPDKGKALIMGRDVFKEKEELKSIIGVVPEETNLYERLTIEQNLQFYCRLYQADSKNIDTYLKQVDLFNESNTQVKKLSKGMRQRVLLIRALLHQPKILFLDEPTSGLDPTSADNIHQILKKLNLRGMTILLTSHNMEEVDKLCHQVAFLNQGQLSLMGSPTELKLKYAENRIKVLIKGTTEEDFSEKVLAINSDNADLIAEWIKQNRLKSIHSLEPTLADIFVKITGRDMS